MQRRGSFSPRERPGTHCTGGWVGPRASLDECRKSRQHHRDSMPGPSSPQRVAIPTELSRPVNLTARDVARESPVIVLSMETRVFA
jgi:hypothetical protein